MTLAKKYSNHNVPQQFVEMLLLLFFNFAVYWSPFYVLFNLIDVIVNLGFMMILVLKYKLIVFTSN